MDERAEMPNDALKEWHERNQRAGEKRKAKLAEKWSPIVDAALEDGKGPNCSQIKTGDVWVVARWMGDMLRDKEYQPSVEQVETLICRTAERLGNYNLANWESATAYYQDLQAQNAGDKFEDPLKKQMDEYMDAQNRRLKEMGWDPSEIESDWEEIDRDEAFAEWDGFEPMPDDYQAVEMPYPSMAEISGGNGGVEGRYRESLRGEDRDTVIHILEEHPSFPYGVVDGDDFDALMTVARAYGERMEGTLEGARVAEWMIDNLDKLLANVYDEERTSFLYLMTDLAGELRPESEGFYTRLVALMASEEKIYTEENGKKVWRKSIFRTSNGGELEVDEYDRWDMMKVVLGFEGRRRGVAEAVVIVLAEEENVEKRNQVLAMIFGEKGVAGVLNYLRQVTFDEQIDPERRQAVESLLKSFWTGVIPTAEIKAAHMVHQNINEFYKAVTERIKQAKDELPAEAIVPMTERREGKMRINFLNELFAREGIGTDELVLELACGNGWLTAALRESGHKVVGVDVNDEFIAEALEKHGGGFYVASWDNLENVPDWQEARAVVINGRSIHHVEAFRGMDRLMQAVGGADLIVWDGLDPKTGGQAMRLEAFWRSLENFGFSQEWLEQYMWQAVGSVDGVSLGDRWVPPQEWWVNILGLHGYDVEVVVESNYDGHGTDNLVYVARKVTDEDEQKEKIESSKRFFSELMSKQPRNQNGYRTDYWR